MKKIKRKQKQQDIDDHAILDHYINLNKEFLKQNALKEKRIKNNNIDAREVKNDIKFQTIDHIYDELVICGVDVFLNKLNSETLTNSEQMFINQWKIDKSPLSICYINNNNLISFALLSKMDFDPYKTHKLPHCINYIYTINKYRNMGYASKLLHYIKDHYQTSAFCSNNESFTLFTKNGFIHHESDIMDDANYLFRFP